MPSTCRALSLAVLVLSLVSCVASCDAPRVSSLEREAARDLDEPSGLLPDGSQHQADASARASLDAPEVGGASLGAIPEVAERVVASVVNLSALRHTRVDRDELSPLYSDPLFRHFFGDVEDLLPPEHLERSLGSGVLVHEGGVILTNNHVVEDAEEVLVSLSDGRELLAEVVGGDPESDLAVLRIQDPPDDLAPLPLGSSSALRLGQTVLAVGNPFGVGQTVTMGIVSATGRGMGIVDYESFIQTDAAINPGNSGGALVNLKGELVGINTAILSRTGGYEGIGFAIPSDIARVVMEDLLDDGVVDRGYLGVHVQDLPSEVARQTPKGSARGALVARVMERSPAEKAGLEAGDVIVAVDGRPVRSAQEVKNAVGLKGSGAPLLLTVRRGDDERTLEVRLDAARASEKETRPRRRRGAR